MSIVGLGGGVGATRLWRALDSAPGAPALTVVGNTADDLWLHGLRVSPDIDTVLYGLSHRQDLERGWGLKDETFRAMETLSALGQDVWFNLGDRDLATHLMRTGMLRDGATPTQVTCALRDANAISSVVLPMCDEEVVTEVHVPGDGWLEFQEFHVRLRAEPVADGVRYRGIEDAKMTPQVADAVASASLIVLAPSNPVSSMLPILSVAGMREALTASPAPVVAITPIVTGVPITDTGEQHRARTRERLMRATGMDHRAFAVAHAYADLVDAFVVDLADVGEIDQMPGESTRIIAASTLIHSNPEAERALIPLLLGYAG